MDANDIFQEMSAFKYDEFTKDSQYFLRSPRQIRADKQFICYDAVEYERARFKEARLDVSDVTSIFMYANENNHPATHTVLTYKTGVNATLFSVKMSEQDRRSKGILVGDLWHVGLIYRGVVYECFDHGQYTQTPINEHPKIKDLTNSDWASCYQAMPVNINPYRLHNELKAGTSCGTYVARCLNMPYAGEGPQKVYWPSQAWDYAKGMAKYNYYWFEYSWYKYQAIHGPYTNKQKLLADLVQAGVGAGWAKAQNIYGIRYPLFNYQGMNIPQFAQYILDHYRYGGQDTVLSKLVF